MYKKKLVLNIISMLILLLIAISEILRKEYIYAIAFVSVGVFQFLDYNTKYKPLKYIIYILRILVLILIVYRFIKAI